MRVDLRSPARASIRHGTAVLSVTSSECLRGSKSANLLGRRKVTVPSSTSTLGGGPSKLDR